MVPPVPPGHDKVAKGFGLLVAENRHPRLRWEGALGHLHHLLILEPKAGGWLADGWLKRVDS